MNSEPLTNLTIIRMNLLLVSADTTDNYKFISSLRPYHYYTCASLGTDLITDEYDNRKRVLYFVYPPIDSNSVWFMALSHACLIMYSLDNKNTIKIIEKFFERLIKFTATETTEKRKSFFIVFIEIDTELNGTDTHKSKIRDKINKFKRDIVDLNHHILSFKGNIENKEFCESVIESLIQNGAYSEVSVDKKS